MMTKAVLLFIMLLTHSRRTLCRTAYPARTGSEVATDDRFFHANPSNIQADEMQTLSGAANTPIALDIIDSDAKIE